MNKLHCGNTTVSVDEEGFLIDQNEWNEDVAMTLAEREGLGRLDQEQFEIVQFMRDYHQKFHAFPILNYVCKNLNVPRNCVNEKFIDPMKAWKIAGLPKPDGIEFISTNDEQFIMQECC